MVRGGSPDNLDAEQAKVLSDFQAAISGMSAAEMREVFNSLMAAGRAAAEPEPRLVPSRRRPKRPDVVTYRVRIDLAGTKPPLWRRLELASDLHLDAVHDIIQAAFGWTDSHLHRFASDPGPYSRDAEQYLCPFDVEEGEPGVPEGDVRLDEVLSKVGDRLYYVYDFGDDWQHILKLEAVRRRDESVPPAVCLDGRRPGPPEDCGGVGMYELITAAADPGNRDHAEAAAELRRFYGDQDRVETALPPFDLGEVNAGLSGLGAAGESLDGTLPGPLAELVSDVLTATGQRRLRQMIADALAQPPDLPDTGAMTHMVRPYTWLLNRVGADGITLTGAGYLPPAHVVAAMRELDLQKEWIGEGNRESQTLPVLHLRESAMKMGLLRKHRGKLVLTPAGRAVAADPVGLWGQLAERMPPRSSDGCETQAGLLFLIAVAAQVTGDLDEIVAQFLGAMGWAQSDGTPLTDALTNYAAWNVKAVLRRVSAYGDQDPMELRPAQLTPNGLAFARAAVRNWPGYPGR